MSLSKHSRIFVAGHQGMVGSAIVRQLRAQGYQEIITRSSSALDLTNQSATQRFFRQHSIDAVFLAAAKVGGIHANHVQPAEFIYQNLMIEANVIHAAWENGVNQLLFLGSSCIYPRLSQQPMQEHALLTGPLEPTNEPYAIAKIAGLKLCESYTRQYGVDYRSVMPTNLYGPHDNFHPEHSHVIPAMIRRFYEAKQANAPEITIWGTGTPMREFLYVDDMASACIHILQLDQCRYRQFTAPMQSHINIGTGQDCSIRQLAETLARVSDFQGELKFDPSKPDGTPRKLLDISRLQQLGWTASTPLEQGLHQTYQWFIENHPLVRH
ncbi:GDP-L-fucose synthase [Photobacterium atrarenae]|uniref:GDP-L-fucose synthase n=1 Tax=Photobacterium atrarenae TaxID=865757 RepID=UPI0026F39AD1|nr:GDP-L-fucose synthase [Photobacterium atrarenae]